MLFGLTKDCGEFRPGIGRTHINDADGLDTGSRQLGKEQARGSPLSTQRQNFLSPLTAGVVERIGRNRDLDPFAAARNDRQHGGCGIGHPHVVLELRHVFLRRAFLRERPRQHELGFEDAPLGSTIPSRVAAIHLNHRMPYPPLSILYGMAGIALVPVPIEVLGDDPSWTMRLPERSSGFGFAALLSPEVEQGVFIVAHDDAGIRAADEGTSINLFGGSEIA